MGSRFGFGISGMAVAGVLFAALGGDAAIARPDCDRAIDGTKRADNLVGSNASERLRGYAGDDRLLGRGGGDCIDARAGADGVRGGSGDDVIHGHRGHDKLRGEGGNDRLRGQTGHDEMSGGKGNDRFGGGPGKDRISGGEGLDKLRGGPSADHIRAADRSRGRAGRGLPPADDVDCGPGDDTAIVDPDDRVRRCENVEVSGSSESYANPGFALPSWGDIHWTDPGKYETIQLADITGDGKPELLGRNFNGVEAHEFDAVTGNWLPLYEGPDPVLSDAEGWDPPEYSSTIQTAQLDGQGGEELIARGSGGVIAWRYVNDTKTWEVLVQGDSCCWDDDDPGWTDPSSYSTIQTGDVDGDGREELIGRDPTDGIEVYGYDEASDAWRGVTQASLELTNDEGYSAAEYYETIHTADFDGEPGVEIYVRASDGIHAWKLNQSATEWVELAMGPPLNDRPFGFDQPEYYETIQAGQLDGQGGEELFVRNNAGILAWTYDPATNTWPELPIGPSMNNNAGWDQAVEYRTIQSADVNGDGRDEILGRSAQGMEVFQYDPGARRGKGGNLVGEWDQLPSAPLFPDAQGWNQLQYSDTIQTADLNGDKAADLIGRSGVGIQNFQYLPGAQDGTAWETTSDPFEDFSESPASIAYAAINEHVNPTQGFDIRASYGTELGSVLTQYRNEVLAMSQPSGVDEATWVRVQDRIAKELAAAILVQDWFDNYMEKQIQNMFVLEVMDTSADELAFDTNSDDTVQTVGVDVVQGMLDVAWATAETTEEGVAIAIISSAISVGVDSMGSGGGGPLGGLDGPYQSVRGDLQQLFQGALTGNDEAKQAVMGDYGLLASASALLQLGVWSPMPADQQALFTAAALRSYTLDVWQFLTPVIWERQEWANDPDCNASEGFICDYVDGSNNGWILENATASQKSQLTATPDPSCATAWNAASCGLGQTYANVFANQAGWNLPLDCFLGGCSRRSRSP